MRRWRWGKVCLVVDDEMVDAATRVSFLHEAATLLPDWLVRANDRLHLPGSRPPPCSRREKGRRRRSVVLYTVRPCTHTVRRAYRDIRDDSFRCGSSPGSGLASRSFFFLPISVRYVCRHYIHWNISNRARLHCWHNTCVCVCHRPTEINQSPSALFLLLTPQKKKSSSSSSFRQVDLNLSYSCRDTRRDRDRVELVEATTCESPASNKVSAPSKHSSRSIARIQRKSTIDVSVAI